MLLLGIDAGTSSIKVSVMDALTGQILITVTHPQTECEIISHQQGWAEQAPQLWWQLVQEAILKANASGLYNPSQIKAIGIAYQMHGLVLVNKNNEVLRHSIIWCDSRAAGIGETAFTEIGKEKCLAHLLNSPANFTASKLKWVKDNEPHIYNNIHKVLLPGDYLAMKFTGELSTTVSALSEGIFWDFKQSKISSDVLNYYGFEPSFFAEVKDVFSIHGLVTTQVANALSLTPGIPVTYKAGDQPNNALSLNVLEPGEVAATAGTSGVIYAVTDCPGFDLQSRINNFAHVNHKPPLNRIGVLLCINGAGILYRWIKNRVAPELSYVDANSLASKVKPGSEGVIVLPFGNGAERMLNNQLTGAHILNANFNIHSSAHLLRAAQEGVACAFRYGLDIMKTINPQPAVIKAGNANLFLSPVFKEAFVNTTGLRLELYDTNGSIGAATGAGIGAKIFSDHDAHFSHIKPIQIIEPHSNSVYTEVYHLWQRQLNNHLQFQQ